jgi:prepilin-type N-terminal cleavage/methylation domain-containing protein
MQNMKGVEIMIKITKKQKGFTLVELLIVIAIIAVLAAVIAPVAVGALEKSKATAVVANVKSLQTAELTYYADNGSVPDDATAFELNSDLKFTKDSTTEFTLGGVTYTYVSGLLTFKETPNDKVIELLTAAGFEDDTAITGFQINLNSKLN